MDNDINAALDLLRNKYGAGAGRIAHSPEGFQLLLPDGGRVELLPHRVERRFIELKKLIDDRTLEEVSTFRFARFESGGVLTKLIAAELDLAVFLAGSRITAIFAVGDEKHVCNAIFRFANGMSGCLECGTMLPPGSGREDRHEIIARRGVASDRVVDTQTAQSSIYLHSISGTRTFTDVDAELFGLDSERIPVVRAAFHILRNPALGNVWNAAAAISRRNAATVLDSMKNVTPLIPGGE